MAALSVEVVDLSGDEDKTGLLAHSGTTRELAFDRLKDLGPEHKPTSLPLAQPESTGIEAVNGGAAIVCSLHLDGSPISSSFISLHGRKRRLGGMSPSPPTKRLRLTSAQGSRNVHLVAKARESELRSGPSASKTPSSTKCGSQDVIDLTLDDSPAPASDPKNRPESSPIRPGASKKTVDAAMTVYTEITPVTPATVLPSTENEGGTRQTDPANASFDEQQNQRPVPPSSGRSIQRKKSPRSANEAVPQWPPSSGSRKQARSNSQLRRSTIPESPPLSPYIDPYSNLIETGSSSAFRAATIGAVRSTHSDFDALKQQSEHPKGIDHDSDDDTTYGSLGSDDNTGLSGPSTAATETTTVTQALIPKVSERIMQESACGLSASHRDTRHEGVGEADPPTSASALSVPIAVERVVGSCAEEMRKDNEHSSRKWLQHARHSAQIRTHMQRAQPTAVFSLMKPIPLQVTHGKDPPAGSAKLAFEKLHTTSKAVKASHLARFTVYHTPATIEVPLYSHYVGTKRNFLAANEKILHHRPYFGDDFDLGNTDDLADHYYVERERERKLLRLGQAENLSQYAEVMLAKSGCRWSDVLRFLFEAQPDVGTSTHAVKVLQARKALCEEDFARESAFWSTRVSNLPLSRPAELATAAMLCEQFQRISKVPLWHVARRSQYVRALLAESSEPWTWDDLTCRVCTRFNCPYHGEIKDVEDTISDDDDVVEKDILVRKDVNERIRVGFPDSIDRGNGPFSYPRDRRKDLDYWQRGVYASLHYRAEEREPFYPCHHPGSSCETAQCSCNQAEIPCEKACGCPTSCRRKFQGCACSSSATKKMICFEDERCACFQLGRECDADLCGDCSVCDVLDPVHRHKDGILQGRCRNANLQRGIGKHTKEGTSGIHGMGLYTFEDIREHDFVGEYTGEIITKGEGNRRGAVYEHQKLSYLFSLNLSQEIDGTMFGNKLRFVNHAEKSKANLYPRIIMVNTVHRIAMYGSREILAGEELFFDYGRHFSFADVQMDGKTKTGKKAIPRARNSALVKDFDEVDMTTRDGFGNLQARKATAKKSVSTSRLNQEGRREKRRGAGRPRKAARDFHDDIHDDDFDDT